MPPRVTAIGLESPHRFRTTIYKCGVLNARALRHVLSEEHLNTLFPDDNGIQFDFSESGKVIMCPEMDVLVDFSKVLTPAGKKHELKLGHVKFLTLGSARVRFEVIESYFPGEIIKQEIGRHEIDRNKIAQR